MSDELEPLAPEIAALLGKLPSAASAAARKAAVWDRIASSAAAVDSVADLATGATAGAAATTAGAAVTGAAAAGKMAVPVIAAALIAGAGAGVAIDRVVLAPAPKVIVKTERVEVPVPVLAPPPVEEAPPEPDPVPPVKVKKPHAPASAEERQLIEAARTALIKRNGHGALEALWKHRKAFAKGQLAEERDALEVQALAQEGRMDQARDAAHRFTRTYPQSVFGPAVDAAVADPEK